jgi:hypothetical protein
MRRCHTLVRQKQTDAGNEADTGLRHDTVRSVARSEDQYPSTTEFIDNRMILAVASPFRGTYCLCLRSPFPPLAQRWIFTLLMSNATRPGASEQEA